MTKKQIEKLVVEHARKSKKASYEIANAKPSVINKALKLMGKYLLENSSMLKRENKKDLDGAKKRGLSPAMIDRLTLSDKVIESMVKGLKDVAAIESPLGIKFDERERPNGLRIYKTKVPIGVVGIIYESRPNVTVDAAAICLKSQNAVILRGGSESYYSNVTLAKLFSKALEECSLPKDAVLLIPTTDREAVGALIKQSDYLDLVIPRGGENLIKTVVGNSHVPVIKHYKGVCHTYVSSNADMSIAIPIVVNAKVQRPGVCNAMETLIIDKKLSLEKRAAIIETLLDEGVTIYGDDEIRKLNKKVKKARKADWDAEYLDLSLAVKSVSSVEEAIAHINTHSSGHTEAIISKSQKEISEFVQKIDSSSVIVNASTRFADGGEYGMGCEIGISTDKLHARGPMGVEDLTTYKWIVEGNGQVRG